VILRKTLAESGTGIKGGVYTKGIERESHGGGGGASGVLPALALGLLLDPLLPETARETSDRAKLQSLQPHIQSQLEARREEVIAVAARSPSATVWANITITVTRKHPGFWQSLSSVQPGLPTPPPSGPIDAVELDHVSISLNKIEESTYLA